MPIRHEDHALSKVKIQEDNWFKKAERDEKDLTRFVYHKKGKKDDYWTFKIDFEKENFNDSLFLIDQEKYVNRPDSIAHKVYGNSKYWWIIALRNNITEPFVEFYKGRSLKIPELNLIKRKLGL